MELHNDIGTIRDLSPLNIQRAYENLNDAISLLSNDRICSAASRAYYSVFRAICAVHALDDNQYKSHKTALAEFNKHYISNETFPRIYGKKMYKLMQLRDTSDYENRIPDKLEVQEYVGFAKIFCKKIKTYCEKELNKYIEVEKLHNLAKAITIEFSKDTTENKFKMIYNQVFEEQCSHDIAATAAGKSLYQDGCDTVTVLTVLDTVAPKAADNDEYACKILKKIQKDPMIEKIIKEQHKSYEQYSDKNISL